MADDNPYDSLFSDEDMAKFSALWGRRWIRIDPVSKKPHANMKEFFWEVVHMFPATPAGGNINKPEMDFQVQRYFRNKTYEAEVEQGGAKTTRNVAWHEINSKGELTAPGYITCSYESFQKQFQPDS